MMQKFWFVIFMLFSTACTYTPTVKHLPPQAQNMRLFKLESEGKQSLLSVQFEKEQWRWVQTDPLGSPQARLILNHAGWKNDGFIMPNTQAKQLFTALSVALNPQKPPFLLDENWKIDIKTPHFTLTLPDGSVWYVEEMATN